MSKVSILMPNFNKAPFLEPAIESVLEQTYPNWELIAVDDGSTDGSVAILNRFAEKDARIKVIRNEKNLGGNLSRNKALELASGEFVMFLDSDDLLAPFCLSQRVSKAEKHAENDMWIFPMSVFKTEPGDMALEHNWIPKEGDQIKRFLTHQLPWQTMQPLWRATFLRKTGGFDPAFIRLQDVELHTRALLEGVRLHVFPGNAPDCFFRTDDGRLSVDMSEFLVRFSQGAIQYYNKFFNAVNFRQRRWLTGTLLETTGNVLTRKRQGLVNHSEAQLILNDLIETCQVPSHRKLLRFYVQLDGWSPFHPKGLKKLMSLALRVF